MTVRAITGNDFEAEVLKSSAPVLVDFWATWCQPCKMMAPILDKFSEEYSETIDVVKIDADENADLVEEFKITSIPTMLVFVNGKMVKSIVGAKNPVMLRRELEEFI